MLYSKVWTFLALAATAGFLNCKSEVRSQNVTTQVPDNRPNVIFILADDLAYADLGSYGQEHFDTPHLDELAKSGITFTQHYAGSKVCAPSRSVLLTGMHMGHTPIRGNKEIQPEGQHPIADSTYTMAEMFKDVGYATGAFGKWGLGYPGSEGDPNEQGFDEFYGYNCQQLAHHYYPFFLRDNQKVDSLVGNKGNNKEEYAPDIIHERALGFIEDNKGKPFFLFYPTPIPHAELAAPNPRAAYATMIHYLDGKVGEIVQKINKLDLGENTIIVFTSDNGPAREGGADPDFFDSNGPLRGYKRDLYEGGIRVPLIVSWPGTIQKGAVSDHISAFWDFMPTFSEIIGVPLTRQPFQDGISFLPSLVTGKAQRQHDHLYWEFHEKGGGQAVRVGKWKAVRYNVLQNPDAPVELYDLSEDIGEKSDVAAQYPSIAKEMSQLMETSRTPSRVFEFSSETYLNSK